VGAFFCPTPTGFAATGNLTVEIDGLKKQSGQVCLSLFTRAEGFPSQSDKAVKTQCVAATQIPLTVTFREVRFGNYAIAVLHDANNDNKMNTNFLGIPSEGIGFSKNPPVGMGPPEFNQVAFPLISSNTNIQIRLRYLF
jgi:uncharacterized protein (DUF2141 family)